MLATIGYDDLGRRTGMTYGNGDTRSYGYDGASRLTGLSWNLLSGSASDQGLSFTYNPAGQIATRTGTNDAYAWTQHYNANRAYATNGLNQYPTAGTQTLGYDGRGNLASISPTTGYWYDNRSQLVSNTGATGLYYDPLGRLLQIFQTSDTFEYDGPAVVDETNGSTTIIRRYVHGPGVDEPLVWYEGSGTSDRRWLHADERGSIAAVSDGTGAMLAINRYDEYGQPQSTNIGRFQYTGQSWIANLALHYYKARFYHAGLGRLEVAREI